MGQILKFPIIVVTDKATEEQFGMLNTLRDSVRPLETASRELAVSERGITQGVKEKFNIWVKADNNTSLPTAEYIPFLNSVNMIPTYPLTGAPAGAGNLVKYHSVSGAGLLSIAEDDNNIYINAWEGSGGVSGAVSGELTIAKTLNGGILQEASYTNYSAFDPTTGVATLTGLPSNSSIVFKEPKLGDAIGKILIKCTEAFDDPTTYFSIGTLYDPEYYVKKFVAPQSIIKSEGDLINHEYGTGLYDKVHYITDVVAAADGYTSFRLQGTLNGFTMGGYNPTVSTVIDAFSFVTDGNATSVGSLATPVYHQAGGRSTTHGFVFGGYTGTAVISDVQKFLLAATTTTSKVSNLVSTKYQLHSLNSETKIFVCGSTIAGRDIERFVIASDSVEAALNNAFTSSKQSGSGGSSTALGFGLTAAGYFSDDVIEKFVFATEAASALSYTLTNNLHSVAQTESADNWYTMGGYPGSGLFSSVIEKAPFATEANSVNCGNLSANAGYPNDGQCSTNYGYCTGQYFTGGNLIDKWAFATDGLASDIGDLSSERGLGAGTQY